MEPLASAVIDFLAPAAAAFLALDALLMARRERYAGYTIFFTVWPLVNMLRLVTDPPASRGVALAVGMSVVLTAMAAGPYLQARLQRRRSPLRDEPAA